MADNIETIQQTATTEVVAPVSNVPNGVDPEVHKMMEQRLNPQNVPRETPTQPVVTQPVTETPIVETPVVTDIFTPFKEKFGYETPEAAIQEIEQLRAFKASPTVAEIKFENEVSEKVFKALQGGKLKEVFEVLSHQERISGLTDKEVNEESAADIIKLGLQLKHKDLTPEEVNYKYNKQFGIPKEPVQKTDEEDEDFAERKSQWEATVADIKMNKIIEAKLMKPELEAAKAKLVFPEIDNAPAEQYAQWQKSLADQAAQDALIVETYKAMKPTVIERRMDFNDEANKINFQFQYSPDADSFSKVVEAASDLSKLESLFVKPDGTPDREKWLKAVDFAINGDKILLEGMKQAKNAAIKANLPDNSTGGLVRELPAQGTESELDKYMRLSGVRRQ